MTAVLERVEASPLFRSAHQALLFAYTFSPNQHGEAAAAERSIAMFGRSRYEIPPRVVSRGLSGLDGAGQAGMIKAQVETLPLHLQRVIEARFAVLSPDVQRRALLELALRARDALPDRHIVLAAKLVRRHYVGKVRLMQLAVEHELSERSIKRRWALVRSMLQQLDQQAMARAEILLERGRVIEPINGD